MQAIQAHRPHVLMFALLAGWIWWIALRVVDGNGRFLTISVAGLVSLVVAVLILETFGIVEIRMNKRKEMSQ